MTWDDYTFDATDDSIEIYGATPSAALFDSHEQNEPANHLCGCKAVRP